MKIKVCGMKYIENILALTGLSIQMIGLIFYKKSPRYVNDLRIRDIKLPENIIKIGVFVNEPLPNMLSILRYHRIQTAQLHGKESLQVCKNLKEQGITVIKSFAIKTKSDLESSSLYEDVCDYFLFDTKTQQFGGSGTKFNWKILSSYNGKIPFFLSGGIMEKDSEIIKQLKNPLLYAVDLNSQFEISPGLKDITKIQSFISYFTQV